MTSCSSRPGCPSGGPTTYLKFGRKHANTPAVVTVAVRLAWDGGTVTDARIALGAVGPHPIRAVEAERRLVGRDLGPDAIAAAAAAAADECEPFTDAIATDWYRRRMIGVFVAARSSSWPPRRPNGQLTWPRPSSPSRSATATSRSWSGR